MAAAVGVWLVAAGATAVAEPRLSELLPVHRTAPPVDPPRNPALPDDDTLEANGAVVGEVSIHAGDIFDLESSEENKLLFRAANRLHFRTREPVIRRLLLFRPGDPYSRRLLEESERYLRSTPYLYDAAIFPVRYEDNRVDIAVVTRDVWTLHLGIGLSRSGGVNRTRIGIQDRNFLGTGRVVTLRRVRDIDRTSYIYRFIDPNVAGRRVFLRAEYVDHSDGTQRQLVLQRPFFALDARWAAGVRVWDDTRILSVYDAGRPVESFRRRSEYHEAFFGRSRGLRDRRTLRLLAGASYAAGLYEAIPGSTIGPAPEDRIFTYPWVGLHWLRDGFVETRDLDRLRRTEDLNLGAEVSARLGWSTSLAGSEPNHLLASFGYGTGVALGPGAMLLARADAGGRIRSGHGRGFRIDGRVRYYRRNLTRHVFFASLALSGLHKPDGRAQLLLGGDSGLRGYPLRFAAGDRRYLFRIEQRFYTDWHVFRLLHVGAALFFDAGEAYTVGARDRSAGLLKDVGFGLRIGSSRSSSASMVHLDVAFPLDRDSTVDKVQFLVRTRETF